MENAEAVRIEICFESKSQSHQTHDAWIRQVMAIPGSGAKILTVEVIKALDYLQIHSITRAHEDLKLLVSRWSVEIHTFVAACRQFGPTLEDVLNLMTLPLYEEANTTGLIFEGKDEDKLQQLTATIGHSKATSSSKSKYASWFHCFDEGEGSRSGLVPKSC